MSNVATIIRVINRNLVSFGRALGLNRSKFLNEAYATVLGKISDIGLPKNQFVKIEIQNGVRFYIDTNDRGSMYSMLTRGAYEPLQTEIFKSILSPGMTFVDVGAHIGYYSMIAAKSVGDAGHIIAFEPRKYSHDLFLRNLAENGFRNVQLYSKAVSDREGVVSFYSDSLYNIHELASGKETIVQTISLSDFLRANGIHKIDAVKLDIEGGEYLALKGMAAILRESPNPMVFLEFNPSFYEKYGGISAQEFWAMLSECGLRTVYVINEHLGRLEACASIDQLLSHGSVNILCLKNDSPIARKYFG